MQILIDVIQNHFIENLQLTLIFPYPEETNKNGK